MRYLIAMVICVLLSASARAELSRAECETLKGPMQVTLVSLGALANNLSNVETMSRNITQKAEGTPTALAAARFEEESSALAAALKSFLAAGEDFTAELQKCAR